MPQIISQMLKNWWTTGTGASLVVMTLIEIGIRTYNGEKLYMSGTEMTSLLAGLGLMKAKDQNITGGDKSNGLVPEPVQQAKARIEVAAAKVDPEVAAVAPVDLVEIAKIQQEMLALQARLDKAKGA